MKDKSRRTTIYFDPSVYQLLRLRAAESDNSVSDLVNDLIEAALDAEQVNREYPNPSAADMRVHESGPGSVGLTERIERLERSIGILGDARETDSEPTVLITLADVKERLASHGQKLKELGVRSLSVFGSLAKQRFRSDSDIDLLVEYEQQAGLFRHIELQQVLANLLEAEIDLVTARSLREEMKSVILQEAVLVYPV
ncbi:nucleotidyltransferase family protein [Gemmatimonadota bacterium]